MKPVLPLLTVLLLAPLDALRAADDLTRKPIIIFILADDLGIGDSKCHVGEHCRIDTPKIDSLAADGPRFTDAHAAAPVCSSNRGGSLTDGWNESPGPELIRT